MRPGAQFTDKCSEKNDETRDEEEEERVRVKLPFPTPGFQSCNNSDEEDEENVVKVSGGIQMLQYEEKQIGLE